MSQSGSMTVEIKNGKAIVGRGTLDSDDSGQIWFDYSRQPYPSSVDWKNATSLTFEPDRGKEKSYLASETEYFFQSGWVGPRLVLRRANRR